MKKEKEKKKKKKIVVCAGEDVKRRILEDETDPRLKWKDGYGEKKDEERNGDREK